MDNYLYIDGRKTLIEGERNLLEVIRKAGVDLPTFCYHSELSIYGACRLCIVEIEGRGIQGACSTIPEHDMKVKTNTNEIREIRKITLELLLANENHNCTSCIKSSHCKLQEIAKKLGIDTIHFTKTQDPYPVDISTYSLTRDPNKCILCGDCVRACKEIQGIGAIDFAFRGPQAMVLPAFGKDLNDVECVDCGQCARVCPTASITPKSEMEPVWKALNDPSKIVIAQIAPAVRIAIGEMFGDKSGNDMTDQITAALKFMGFNKVFDTAFSADLTVIEEANEFLKRKESNSKLPIFTSCCPAWVKFSEQYYPELLENLSSCRSPQQMFGSIAKDLLTDEYKCERKDLVVVSIMPCTAKKFEAKREEFYNDGYPDVDYVITTQELANMIDAAGIMFTSIPPEPLDMPLGFKTGAGVIFGNSGGVTEAALRYLYEKLSGKKLDKFDFLEVRDNPGIKETVISIDGKEVKIAIVYGLKNARTIADKVKAGKSDYDFIEVMACPGGCIGGAGQPVSFDADIKKIRAKSIYSVDKKLQLHQSQDNPFVTDLYKRTLVEPNSHKAHELLHTEYKSRKRTLDDDLSIIKGKVKDKLEISVCVGTSCFIRGSQKLLHNIIGYIDDNNLQDRVDVKAAFCFEKCDKGPTVKIGGREINGCTLNDVISEINK